MAIAITKNEAVNLKPKLAKRAVILFTTDAVAGLTTNVTSTVNNNNITASSGTGFANGDAISIANADSAGTGPWFQSILTGGGTTTFNVNVPSVRTAVSAQPATRWEKFVTTLTPKKITLVNLTNLDEYVWERGMATRSVIKTTTAGVKTLVTGNTIWPTTSITYIHPDILPASSNYKISFEY